MSDTDDRQPATEKDHEPDTEELTEPSVAKDPGEEPKGGSEAPEEPSHEAVGIGVVGRPQVEPDTERTSPDPQTSPAEGSESA